MAMPSVTALRYGNKQTLATGWQTAARRFDLLALVPAQAAAASRYAVADAHSALPESALV